jgi:hypothetical protein
MAPKGTSETCELVGAILRFLTPTLDFLGNRKSQRLFESNRVFSIYKKYQRHFRRREDLCIYTFGIPYECSTQDWALGSQDSCFGCHPLSLLIFCDNGAIGEKKGRVWLSEQVCYNKKVLRSVVEPFSQLCWLLSAWILPCDALTRNNEIIDYPACGILCFLLAAVNANAEVRGLRQDERKLPQYETVSKSTPSTRQFYGSMSQSKSGSKPDYTKPPHTIRQRCRLIINLERLT